MWKQNSAKLELIQHARSHSKAARITLLVHANQVLGPIFMKAFKIETKLSSDDSPCQAIWEFCQSPRLMAWNELDAFALTLREVCTALVYRFASAFYQPGFCLLRAKAHRGANPQFRIQNNAPGRKLLL